MQPVPLSTPVPEHEHHWVVESTHNTSEGVVSYLRCAGPCSARRVALWAAAAGQ